MTTALAINEDDRQLLADLSEAIDDRTDLGDGNVKQRKFWKRASDLVSRLSAVLPAPTPHVFVRVDGGMVHRCNARGLLMVTVLDADHWECVSRDGSHDAECPDHTSDAFAEWVRESAEADSLPEIPC